MNGQLARHDTAESVDERRRENPFATRYTKPGALPYLFEAGESVATIVARFFSAGRCAAIIGPHGSGKSTLLEALQPALRETGMNPIFHALHDGQRRMPQGFAAPTRSDDVLIVDGYEQLGWWGRREVRQAVERAGAGLLVTAHATVRGLPTLVTTRSTLDSARRVVQELLPSSPALMPAFQLGDEQLRRLYEQCDGNLRELLFKLYDLYESQRS